MRIKKEVKDYLHKQASKLAVELNFDKKHTMLYYKELESAYIQGVKARKQLKALEPFTQKALERKEAERKNAIFQNDLSDFNSAREDYESGKITHKEDSDCVKGLFAE